LLSRKSNLDSISKLSLETEWIEYFTEDQEKSLLSLKSVNSLFNSIK
jgi:hypothetical protein